MSSRRSVVNVVSVFMSIAVTVLLCTFMYKPHAYAETSSGHSGGWTACESQPALTDFGQVTLQPAMEDGTKHVRAAAFVTLYPDGRGAIQVHGISDDAVAAFANGAPGWRLDHGLMWFVQMPVYVREVRVPQGLDDQSAV